MDNEAIGTKGDKFMGGRPAVVAQFARFRQASRNVLPLNTVDSGKYSRGTCVSRPGFQRPIFGRASASCSWLDHRGFKGCPIFPAT